MAKPKPPAQAQIETVLAIAKLKQLRQKMSNDEQLVNQMQDNLRTFVRDCVLRARWEGKTIEKGERGCPTPYELAVSIGMSSDGIRALMNGRARITMDKALLIANRFGYAISLSIVGMAEGETWKVTKRKKTGEPLENQDEEAEEVEE